MEKYSLICTSKNTKISKEFKTLLSLNLAIFHSQGVTTTFSLGEASEVFALQKLMLPCEKFIHNMIIDIKRTRLQL